MNTNNLNENVIPLFGKAKPRSSSENGVASNASETEKDVPELSFEEIVKRNMENTKRMQEDRKKANKNVIRSYRLKK